MHRSPSSRPGAIPSLLQRLARLTTICAVTLLACGAVATVTLAATSADASHRHARHGEARQGASDRATTAAHHHFGTDRAHDKAGRMATK